MAEILKLKCGKDFEAEVWSRFLSWSLVKSLKLRCGWNVEVEVWSRVWSWGLFQILGFKTSQIHLNIPSLTNTGVLNLCHQSSRNPFLSIGLKEGERSAFEVYLDDEKNSVSKLVKNTVKLSKFEIYKNNSRGVFLNPEKLLCPANFVCFGSKQGWNNLFSSNIEEIVTFLLYSHNLTSLTP